MTLDEEIERELTTFKGTTFSSPEEAHDWLRKAMRRIAEKTVEAVRVTGIPVKPIGSPNKNWNQAAYVQTQRARAWLGTNTPEKVTKEDEIIADLLQGKRPNV